MVVWLFRFVYCLCVALLIGACEPSSTLPAAPDATDYFPIQSGHYSIYDVSEQRFSLTTAPVSLTYQVKETIGPAYTDVGGKPAYQLLRYRRTTDAQPWMLDSLWSIRRSSTEGIRTESGRDVVKVVFPVVENARWNANRLNALGADDYMLRNVGKPFAVSGMSFGETATVVQQTDSTLVAQDERLEVYARTIGLIYKETVQVQFCTATPECIGKNQVTYGSRQVYRIRTIGTE